jgi:hypothetical protein
MDNDLADAIMNAMRAKVKGMTQDDFASVQFADELMDHNFYKHWTEAGQIGLSSLKGYDAHVISYVLYGVACGSLIEYLDELSKDHDFVAKMEIYDHRHELVAKVIAKVSDMLDNGNITATKVPFGNEHCCENDDGVTNVPELSNWVLSVPGMEFAASGPSL